MASIEKRINGKGEAAYRVKVRLKGYPVQSETFSRLTDARKWAQQTETAIREGRHFKTLEAKKHTLDELINRYIKDALPSKKTAKDQERQLNWWKDQIGKHLLSDVTPPLLVEQRDKLKNGLTKRKKQRSPSTVNRYLAAISHVFTIAMNEYGWLEDNPIRKVGNLKEPRGRIRFLSDDEISPTGQKVEGERTRLLITCKESKSRYLYPVVILALSSGMRQGEIMKLTWEDVDLTQGRITLHDTKNEETRVVPLVGYALEIMIKHAKVRRIGSKFVFPSQNGKKPADIRDAWKKAVERAGVSNFRFHDLRHSAASYLAMNGASLAEIAEVLGHKTLQMVQRYSHLSESHTAGVVGRMNDRIFGVLND